MESVEDLSGRAFEITPEGESVWELARPQRSRPREQSQSAERERQDEVLGVREEQRNADAAPEVRAEDARDHEVDAADTHLEVGGDGRQRDTRDNRNGRGNGDDE